MGLSVQSLHHYSNFWCRLSCSAREPTPPVKLYRRVATAVIGDHTQVETESLLYTLMWAE